MLPEILNETIREIVVKYPQSIEVFEKYKIDYCCGSQKSLLESCQSIGLEAEQLWREIQDTVAKQSEKIDFPERKEVSDLADYILDRHHTFAKDAILRLKPLMEKVCQHHGEKHSELLELQRVFLLFADELLLHLKKEETVLFPYIKMLAEAISTGFPLVRPIFGTVKNPVRMMMIEHDASADLLIQMRSITKDYELPENACSSFSTLYQWLEKLEKDLKYHTHLENNVLFPKAIELEEKVFGEKIADVENVCCQASLTNLQGCKKVL